MRQIMIALSFILAMAVIPSCNPGDEGTGTKLPGVDILLEDMNSQLRLYAPPEANSFAMKDNLAIVAENLSDQPILFPQDYGIKVFTQQDEQWMPVENAFHYPSVETTLLPKADEPLGGKLIVLLPAVIGDQPISVRVVVVGQMGRDSVAAYIDVMLHP